MASSQKKSMPNLGTLSKPLPSGNKVSEQESRLLQNFERNKAYAKPGDYFTTLTPDQEKAFRTWLKENHVNFDPDSKITDYDMRGFWLSEVSGGAPETQINKYDNKIHYTDKYKTPYDRTFSNESMYATPEAPHWKDDRYLIDKDGNVIFDQKTQNEDSGWNKIN